MIQRLDECERVLTMQVIVKSTSVEKLSLSAFDEAIATIAQTPRSEITQRAGESQTLFNVFLRWDFEVCVAGGEKQGEKRIETLRKDNQLDCYNLQKTKRGFMV